jgi:hypothetical protein
MNLKPSNMDLQFKLPTITPRYILETRRYLSLSVLIALVSLLVIVLGIVPQIQASLGIQQKITVEGKRLATLEQKARQLEDILTPPILAQIDTVNILLPSRKPLLELLSSLNQVATQTEVTVAGIELSPGSIATESTTKSTKSTSTRGQAVTTGKSSSVTDSLEVDLSIHGSLAQLNQFFSLVEKTAPLTTITSLSLSPTTKSSGLTSANSVTIPLSERLAEEYEANITVSAAYFTQSISAAVEAQLPALNQSQQTIVEELANFSVQPFEKQPNIQGGGLEDLFGVDLPPIEVTN